MALLNDSHVDAVREERPPVVLTEERPPSAAEFLESWFSRSPRERHYAVKRRLYRPYSEQSVESLKLTFEAVARECADALPPECDLIGDFLTPFWFRATARMLGVEEGQYSPLANVVGALSKSLELNSLDQRAIKAIDACMRYLRALVELLLQARNPTPLVEALIELGSDKEIGGVWNVVSALSQLLTAGLNPTISGAAMAWRALNEEPGLMAAVRAGSIEISAFTDEVLRLSPPFPFLHRWVREKCNCQGVVLDPGSHLMVDVRAVNRDPHVFERPEEFAGSRDHGLSLSFGQGPHRCLGMAVARSQVTIALRMLLSLEPPLRLADGPDAVTVSSGHLTVIKKLLCRRERLT